MHASSNFSTSLPTLVISPFYFDRSHYETYELVFDLHFLSDGMQQLIRLFSWVSFFIRTSKMLRINVDVFNVPRLWHTNQKVLP